MSNPYVDTSALAKLYLNERGSEEFETFIVRQERAAISRLTAVEFRCLLARRRRAQELSAHAEGDVLRQFRSDVFNGYLEVHPLLDEHAHAAMDLLDRLRTHPLRTLDALHLAIATALGIALLATADHVMAQAAAALGFRVEIFG
jgi:predicted nucleic acid-binding protein